MSAEGRPTVSSSSSSDRSAAITEPHQQQQHHHHHHHNSQAHSCHVNCTADNQKSQQPHSYQHHCQVHFETEPRAKEKTPILFVIQDDDNDDDYSDALKTGEQDESRRSLLRPVSDSAAKFVKTVLPPHKSQSQHQLQPINKRIASLDTVACSCPSSAANLTAYDTNNNNNNNNNSNAYRREHPSFSALSPTQVSSSESATEQQDFVEPTVASPIVGYANSTEQCAQAATSAWSTLTQAYVHNNNNSNYNFNNNNNSSSKPTCRTSSKTRVVINCGGVRFETYYSTLKLISESRLANLSYTNSDFDPVGEEFFFDRDPKSFLAILNYYRTGKLHAPIDVCGNLFYEELNFWGIGERSIQPCCWTLYSSKRDCDEILRKIMDGYEDEDDTEEDRVPTYSSKSNRRDSVIRFPRESKRNWLITFLKISYARVRPSLWRFLDDRKSSIQALIFFWVSVVFLVMSIVNFVMETSALCRVPQEIAMNKSLTRRDRDARTVPHPVLTNTELVCNVFFAIEFVLRFLSAPNKAKFVRNLYNFLEFLAILPLFWPAETELNKHHWGVKVHNYIEVFYVLRILRIFVLVPKYSGLRVLLLTIKNSIGELILYLVMLLMTIMIFASFIYYAEQIFEEDDNKFDSVLIGLWWAIVTMTTLGYGDIVPVTPFGYIVGGLCALTGLIFMALPVPVIVNNFTTFYAHAKARQKLKEYSEVQKNLPNRAIALHLQTIDIKKPAPLTQPPPSLMLTPPPPLLPHRSASSLVNGACQIRQRSSSTLTNVPATQHSERTLLQVPPCAHTSFEMKCSASDIRLNELIRSTCSMHNTTQHHLDKRSVKISKLHRKDLGRATNDANTLIRWKLCKRRTIRRFAIVDDHCIHSSNERVDTLAEEIKNASAATFSR